MVRRTRLWKGKKWQFAVKQQQQNDDGDDVAVSTDDSHFVFCNRPALNAQFRYVTNMTSTRKYSWWSFLPRSLFEQYRRAAYWYFTAMAALSLAPFSPYNRFSVWLPLAFVLILGILRELWEDLRRYRGDNLVNSRPVLVHDGEGHLLEKQWKHLCVGDVVKVTDGDYFPADLLLLSSTGPDGICYVETMNLDGETNLKVRQALQVTWAIGSKDEGLLRKFEANVKCEDPNASLYTFAGLLEFPDGEAYPIGPSQLLLRDSSLQNTGSVIGVVIYTGHDTKVMQNSSPVPSKRSRLDRSLDRVIWVMFAVLLTLSSTTGIVLGLWIKNEGTSVWYLQPRLSDPYFNPAHAVIAGIISSLNGLVLYGYLIPISLYVSLEVVRVLQAALMMQDVQMYDPATDKPCRVKSAGLNEELGQVDTILTDKTGTLTCNQMDFFRCSIGGVSYGKGTTEVEASAARLGLPLGGASLFPDAINHESQLYKTGKILDSTTRSMTNGVESADHILFKEKGFNFYDARLLGGNWATEENSQSIELFFRILALCHTAIPDGNVDNPSSMRYRAESPDEAALVVAAKQFGFYFYKRTPTTLYMRETLGPKAQPVDCKYQLLNVLEFSSARKRMSVIVRFPDGKLLLLCKGADSVVLQRLDPNNKGFSTQTNTHLKQYGEVGLRTLLIAYKELKEEEYIIWQAKFEEARSTLGRERDMRTEEAAEEIERGLTVVGGTGVEDKLQAGVPESVDRLAKAGIKIWVLTGDKMETAINIGYACSLLRQGMDKLIVSMEGVEARNVEEKAERDGLSRNEISKELQSLVTRKLEDALQLVQMHNVKPQEVSNSERHQLSFSSSLHSALSHSFSKTGSPSESQSPNSIISRTLSSSLQMSSIQNRHKKTSLGQTFAQKIKNQETLEAKTLVNMDYELEYALIIDGQSLAYILADNGLQELFLQVCLKCASVLCCRVSPRQKAQVTKLVKKGLGQHRLCLAIGDGANDVGMIQAANVGVGITGVEGAQVKMLKKFAHIDHIVQATEDQAENLNHSVRLVSVVPYCGQKLALLLEAAMAADYAIAQFRFLERLLLVHGRWCYRRISLMILYFFYKVCLLGFVSFYSNTFAHFSGQPLYLDWYASFYNTVFTCLPVCVIAVLDQDVSPLQAYQFPQLYKEGQESKLFNKKTFSWWLCNSWYSSLIIFFFPLTFLHVSAFRSDGHIAARQDFGQAMFTGLVLVPNLQLFSTVKYFTWLHHLAIWGSICLWYLFVLLYGAFPPKWSTVAYKEFIEVLAPSLSYWLLQLLVVVAALLPDFAFSSYKAGFHPADYQIVCENASVSTAEDQ